MLHFSKSDEEPNSSTSWMMRTCTFSASFHFCVNYSLNICLETWSHTSVFCIHVYINYAAERLNPSSQFIEHNSSLLMWTVTRVTARQDGLTAIITHITQATTPEIKQTLSNGQSGPDPVLTIHFTAVADLTKGGRGLLNAKLIIIKHSEQLWGTIKHQKWQINSNLC